MKKRLFKSDNHAVVSIVTAFLIVGLVVTVISVIQTQYVPKWMEEKEAEHMNQVADQLAQLKYSIDTHVTNKRLSTPISTSITLGSKEMPYLMSVRAFGKLEILNKTSNINITNLTSNNLKKHFNYSFGSIKYTSANAYYLNQIYTYEFGAIILSQKEGNIIRMKPAFSVKYEENVTLTLNMVNITTIGGKKTIAGYGTYPIQTEYLGYEPPLQIINVSNITFHTQYTNAWYIFLNKTLIKAGLNYPGYGTDYWINVTEDTVSVEFSKSITVNVDLNIFHIGAQIAPGWIENS